MTPTRRRLLQAVSMAPTLAAPLSALSAQPARELRRRDFEPLLSKTFSAEQAAGASVTLVLKTATPLSVDQDADRCFRLTFEAPQGDMTQGLWNLSHPALGSHALFLSPNDAQGREVEAVFNRL